MARIRINRPRENDTGNPLIDNPDLATLENDARLSDIEARLNRLYGDAAKDVTEQLDSFLERFAERDEEMADRVARGEITQDEYIRWRQGQILRTRQMEQQIESLTNDMVNADQLAMQMVNGELPDVYVSSYNYTGFRGETLADAAGYSYNSFTLYNADAIRIIAAEDPDLIPWQPPEVDIPRDMRWNRQHIQNAIAHGILTGASINEISDSLMPIVNMDRNAATRTARTAFTAVQNQARRDGCARLRENGIPMVEPWMSVLRDNTRDTHLQLHGTYPNADGLYGEGIIGSGHLLRFPGDPNGDPEQIYNCQCSVQSYIQGLDHSRDRELYADMMRREHYDDWVGQRDGYTINGVQDYRIDEQRRALERRRALNAGEVENRENRYRRRLQERQGESVAAPVTTPRTLRNPAFSEARSISEAEEYARQYVKGGFNLTGNTINYANIDLDVANNINHQLTILYDNFDLEKLSSIESFGKKNKKLFEKHSDAPFLTSNFGNLGMNSTILGKKSTINKYVSDGRANFQYVMDNISSLHGPQLQLARTYQTAGRSLVDDSINGMVSHEIGHHISYMGGNNTILANISRNTDWQTYASHISGYANHSFGEYVAESFTAYVNGETDILQPEIIELFDSLRR